MVAIDIEEIMETRTHSVLVVLLAESSATSVWQCLVVLVALLLLVVVGLCLLYTSDAADE